MKIKFLGGSEKEFGTLRNANLSYADLSGADLRYAIFDFSVFPIWCGSFDIKVDIDFVYQLFYHICKLDFDDTDGIKNVICGWANKAGIISRHNLLEIKP